MVAPNELDQAATRAFETVGGVLGLDAWPDVPVRWNRRLRRAGRAIIHGAGRWFESAVIELSPAYFEVYPQDLYGILAHEVVHVGLAVQGRPFGHGPAFQAACRGAGGLLHGRSLPGRVFLYRCPVCGELLERRRRLAGDRWCAPCVAAAARTGVDAYAADRALLLVGTTFAAPEVGCPDAGG